MSFPFHPLHLRAILISSVVKRLMKNCEIKKITIPSKRVAIKHH